MNEFGFTCPECGSADIRRSHRRGFGEVPKMVLGIYPFRCLACSGRFYGNVWMHDSRGFAKCPNCLRLNVSNATRRGIRLGALDRLKAAFGAHWYRCEPCRRTFLSFRKIVQATATPTPQAVEAEQNLTPE